MFLKHNKLHFDKSVYYLQILFLDWNHKEKCKTQSYFSLSDVATLKYCNFLGTKFLFVLYLPTAKGVKENVFITKIPTWRKSIKIPNSLKNLEWKILISKYLLVEILVYCSVYNLHTKNIADAGMQSAMWFGIRNSLPLANSTQRHLSISG